MQHIKLPRPPSISIAELSQHDEDSTFGVPMYTMLFRNDCYLPESLEMLYARNPNAQKLSVISAGSSNGAEADSLLALHNQSGYLGGIAIKGLDINAKALVAAGSAEYLLRELSDQEVTDEVIATLSGLGFEVGEDVIENKSHIVYRRISSKKLREGHDITFDRCDLRDPLPLAKPADLIMANNVLQYFESPDALAIVDNLARQLNDRGILSFGNTLHLSNDAICKLADDYDLHLIDSRQRAFVRE